MCSKSYNYIPFISSVILYFIVLKEKNGPLPDILLYVKHVHSTIYVLEPTIPLDPAKNKSEPIKLSVSFIVMTLIYLMKLTVSKNLALCYNKYFNGSPYM